MACALETLCGQAYGAQQYRKLGIHTYTAIFCLILVCIPLSVLWLNMGRLLVFIGQDPLISHDAGNFISWLIPALFGYATFQPLIRYFQTQSLITPMLKCSCASLIVHIPLCWVLVFKSGLESIGGALAISISNWLNAIFLSLYMWYSPTCTKTRVPITMELFQEFREFFHFAIPSAVMVCLEWWSFELLIMLSGFLPNPKLETSVLSVCFSTFPSSLNTITTLYAIPHGIGAAASTRVSNELGAWKPQAAHVAVYAAMALAVLETLITAYREFFQVKQNYPFGIARGCGWQHIGAYVNLAAFYLVGIPVATTLAFWLHLRGIGLWIGIQVGAFTQTILLAIVTSCINWEKQASKEREKLFQGLQ
ncbi:hypothetical protein GOBAR_AA14053 [Gossypium barbadense]|uniref:Polysaccharide biosynthesis protein C-terminal domain-containing protein n=1 Tax=Gossypium barbadense TaxID=3634 RepID=A0A2P5XTC7_GOSBA|nr:hypothetical protein GOBAR_AA14053 [Gossypium barbadense]